MGDARARNAEKLVGINRKQRRNFVLAMNFYDEETDEAAWATHAHIFDKAPPAPAAAQAPPAAAAAAQALAAAQIHGPGADELAVPGADALAVPVPGANVPAAPAEAAPENV